MNKSKKNQTTFSKRIGELQLLRRYSTNYVMENLLYDDGEPVIKDRQVLDKYKSGERTPRRFEDALKAFAKFYGVTTDYLLGADDTPNRQIQSVQEFTGLSENAVRRLEELKNTYPDILAMVDAIIAGAVAEDITLFINLYQQIYDDYVDTKQGVRDSAYDPMKSQKRFFLTQNFYNHLQSVVIAKLTSHFDNKMLADADWREYEQSQEYLDTMPEIPNPSSTFTPDDSSNE